MKLGEMRDQCRRISGDTAKPYKSTDDEWNRFLNDAQNEACRRARLLVDSTTADLCEIQLNASDTSYELDPRVLFVRRVRLDGESLPLGRVSYKDLDAGVPGWEDETGLPRGYVPDFETGKLRPYPAPDDTYTAKLTVVRLPLADMAKEEDAPEVRPHLHEALLDWALHRHFAKPDPDVHDDTRAKYHLARFELEFGPKSSALDEQWIETQYGFTPEEGVL